MRAPRRPPFALLALLTALSSCGTEPESPRRAFASDVEACSARMRELYQGLVAARGKGWAPAADAPLLEAPFATGAWSDTDATRGRTVCPGVGPGAGRYAERDLQAFPLERFPTRGTEILVACPDSRAHAGIQNALYADGSVKTFSLAQEIEEGRLPEGSATIPIGPDSPIEDLQRVRRMP